MKYECSCCDNISEHNESKPEMKIENIDNITMELCPKCEKLDICELESNRNNRNKLKNGK